jgi:hypothetical protein
MQKARAIQSIIFTGVIFAGLLTADPRAGGAYPWAAVSPFQNFPDCNGIDSYRFFPEVFLFLSARGCQGNILGLDWKTNGKGKLVRRRSPVGLGRIASRRSRIEAPPGLRLDLFHPAALEAFFFCIK